MDIKQLREEYKKAFGTKAFNGWSVEQLQEKLTPTEAPKETVLGKVKGFFSKENENIDEAVKSIADKTNGEDEDKTEDDKADEIEDLVNEEARSIAEAKRLNSRVFRRVDDSVVPVMIEGEPHCLDGNKYIPYNEAVIKRQKQKIVEEVAKLKGLEETEEKRKALLHA